MLDILAREVASAKKNVDDGQVKRFVGTVPVKLATGP